MASRDMQPRPALGQVVQIGTLYDAVNDRFLDSSIFTARHEPHSDVVNVRTVNKPKATTVGLITNVYKDKFKLLGVSADLGASVMGWLLEFDDRASDAGAYLVQSLTGGAATQASLVHRSVGTMEKLKLKAKEELVNSIDKASLCHPVATHVVAVIEWGIEAIVDIKLAHGANPSDRPAAGGVMEVAEGLKTALEGVDNAQGPSLKPMADQALDISIYSNIMPLTINSRSLHDVVASIRQSCEPRVRGTRGMPVMYRLLPIDQFRRCVGNGTADDGESDSDDYEDQEDRQVGPKVVKIDSERLEKLSTAFESLLATHRSLVEYKAFLSTHQLYAQPAHVSAVRKLADVLWTSISHLRHKYGTALREVRAGTEPMGILTEFHDSVALTADNLRSETYIVDRERCKVEFIARAVDAGAVHLGSVYLGSKTGVTLQGFLAEHNRGDQEAYVLSFGLAAMFHDSWADNELLLFELLNTKGTTRSPVVLMDYDANGQRLDEPRITKYQGNQQTTRDLLDERQFLADKCLAQPADRTYETDNVQQPVSRRVVRIPCPNPNCDKAKVHSWLCAKCHSVLEYGYSDQYIYCQCGRSHFHKFEFKCSDVAQHGLTFVPYENSRQFETLLKSLPSSDYLNILILGETGVGKSTFINAFINYLSFESLDEALDSERLHWIIPCSFSTQVMDRKRLAGKITEHHIVVGKRDDESDGSRGSSATQKASVYPINIGPKTIRLIDTPGVGDTRGLQADKKNMADILATINSYEELHGILILLKSNNSRLTVTFRFCIQELLTHLHRDALHNIAFGFTNTRISNYTPGDTFGPLKTLLEQHPNIQLPLNGDTTYCFDSESFRYLAAKRQGVDMENEDSFRRSWAHSNEETQRLIRYFRSRRPHLVTNTVSLNGTRQLILGLTKPMADISQLIQQNIVRCKAQEQALADYKLAGDDLRKRLQVRKVLLRCKQLARPRTVCCDRQCIEVKDNGSGQNVTDYKSHCHPGCYLNGVQVEALGTPDLAQCWAFSGNASMCRRCGHNWRNHMHIMYELEPYTATVTDTVIQKQLDANAGDARVREVALQQVKQQIAEYRDEHDRVRRAAAVFGAYLKAKSIAAYNDATVEYLEEQIRLEKEVFAVSGDRTKLDALKRDLECHQELVEALTMGTKLPDGWPAVDAVLEEATVDKLVKEMYGLKHFGSQLQEVHSTIKQAHQATYRERPYRVSRKKSGRSPTRSHGHRGPSGLSRVFHSIGSTLREGVNYVVPSRFGGGSGPDPSTWTAQEIQLPSSQAGRASHYGSSAPPTHEPASKGPYVSPDLARGRPVIRAI
ncbi:Putative aaa atpase domain containing protein [Madurella fahalii]|uniref:Aaa atpase domain containing protein n=1 Tax=Madurella fahalii TaxID=1157608 RepID=A0ABQ0GLZ6_9PEZI